MQYTEIVKWYQKTMPPTNQFDIPEGRVINPQRFWFRLGQYLEAGDQHEDWDRIRTLCLDLMQLDAENKLHAPERELEL